MNIKIEKRTVLLHDAEELDDDFRAGPDHALTLAGLLGVVDVFEGIVQDGCSDHFGGWQVSVMRFSSQEAWT